MKQQPFEDLFTSTWEEYDALLIAAKSKSDTATAYRLPSMYREICNHYALAQSRYYSPHLIDALHQRVLEGHQLLYRQNASWGLRTLMFLIAGFPRLVRKTSGYFWLSFFLFYGPAISMGAAAYTNPDMIYSLIDVAQVEQAEYMYDPTNETVGRDKERTADTNFKMFGFYIFNNISIGFRCFAMGILLGIGTVFMLVFNGLNIGGIAGHLTQLGYTETFWSFVCGHGAFELTGIVICGAAGLRLARPLFGTGKLAFSDSITQAGIESSLLALGGAFLLLLAAFVEAFWSPLSEISAGIKYIVAGVLWLSVVVYLTRFGRSNIEPR